MKKIKLLFLVLILFVTSSCGDVILGIADLSYGIFISTENGEEATCNLQLTDRYPIYQGEEKEVIENQKNIKTPYVKYIKIIHGTIGPLRLPKITCTNNSSNTIKIFILTNNIDPKKCSIMFRTLKKMKKESEKENPNYTKFEKNIDKLTSKIIAENEKYKELYKEISQGETVSIDLEEIYNAN